MRSFVALAVRRRVAVLMTAIAATAFGVVGYQRLPLDLLPDIAYPSLTIQTEFPDTAPSEVENLITRPIEESVGVLKGLRSIHSVSRSGVSEVTLEFDWGSEMDLLSMDVREKLDRLILPDNAEDPIVLRFDPSLDPIMRIAFSGSSDLTEIRRIADRRVKQEFETIKGVAAARVKGGYEEEIQIDVHQDRLAALGISLQEVRQVVGISNVNLPGGSLEDEQSQYLIRTVNEYDSVEEIANLILRRTGNATVRLRDVADVLRGTKEREEITRVDGKESVEISIFKEGDANTVTTARAVRRRMEELNTSLPKGASLNLLFDQSRFIERSINEVRGAALLGGILAILILLAFLRHPRSTLIIATSIPISVIVTFVAMYRLDVSLNIMSLGGLTLGIGMLVDNSIVVLESIHRRRREGLGLAAAAVEGTTEVGGAVVASTLTTVAVFLPIVFVEGIAGQLFGDMALTVTLSLLASLAVAVTLIPMLAAIGRDREQIPTAPASRETPAREADAMTLGRFSRFYDRLLRGALRRPLLTAGSSVLLLGAALLSTRYLGTELIPKVHEGEFFFEVSLPEGVPIEATDRAMKRMEEAVGIEEGVAFQYSSIGSRLVSGGLSLNTKAEHLGQLNVVLHDREDEKEALAVAERLRREFETIPDLATKTGTPSYFSLKTPVEVVLYGEDLESLRDYSLDLERVMRGVPGLIDVRSSLEAGSPEIQIVFDRDRLAALGLDMRRISQELSDRIQGVVPTQFKEADRQIDIRVRNRQVDRATLEDVRNLAFHGAQGQAIRLLTVADVRIDRGPAEIHRIQQQRAAVVSGNTESGNLGEIVRRVRGAIASSPPPPGLTVEISGQNEEMQVSFASLRFALALAVFLVYLVMAATFESLLHPLIVLFTIPMALIGVMFGLHVTGTEISVIVFLGAVMLVGIVVNNAIVLIDKVNQLRRSGATKRDAVIEACHVRFRPILMTTLTTVLGLLPMSLSVGEGSELRTPLGITVSFGLSFGMILTLIVIPVVYVLTPSRMRADEPSPDPVRAYGGPLPERARG